ncbi:MAG: ATP-dependent RecD-like DNA helicase [Bacillaceae bacterium]
MQQAMDLFDGDEKYIKAQSIVTVFHNDENMYTVARVKVLKTNENLQETEIMVTGYFPKLQEEDVYTFFGTFKEHPRYGKQYAVQRFQKELPETKDGIVQYLSSDLFKGIGRKTAERIVKDLGESAILRIMDEPSVLDKIKGLSGEKAKLIYDTIMENQGLETVMGFLNRYGFGTRLSIKIYQAYKEETMEVLRNNPYKMIEDVDGIGFLRADEIGRAMNISGDHRERIRAALLFSVNELCLQEGHVYIDLDGLVDEALRLLNHHAEVNIEEDAIIQELAHLQNERKLMIEDESVYMPTLFYAEKGLVKSIEKLLQKEEMETYPQSEFLLSLGEIEERLGVQYADRQRDAIEMGLKSPLFILTGGPGTGKTTVINGIVEMFAAYHDLPLDQKSYSKEKPFPIVLAAPTGRAAKRITESTGLPASTIHRLLGWTLEGTFAHDETNPIGGKLLIIDEFSMVDIWLANHLFKSLPADMQVIIVGDEDQLPSVGPGQVLRDLLASERIPTVRLTEIYRQAGDSSIIQLAHSIKDGKLPADIMVKKADRSFISCTSQQVVESVKQVCKNAKTKGFHMRDVQVLAPMYRGNAGINALNVALQEVFNPKREKVRELQYGDVVYRVGDKVLQLVNQPDQNVFNGDMGEIVSVFYAKENTEGQDMLVIDFDGTEVTYPKSDFNQITHAYCCSIHKSQGSEFPIVIMPVVRSYSRMLRKNLLYTGITRSKNFLILVGEEDAFRMGISQTEDGTRHTSLCQLLRGETKEKPSEEDEFLPVFDDDDPLAHLSPYDFMDE